MRSPALFELFARVLREHPTRGGAAPIEVIPVVLVGDQFDDLDGGDTPVLDVVEAISRYADAGAFADAGRAASDAEPCVSNAVLLGALRGTLRLSRGGTSDVGLTLLPGGRLGFEGVEDELLSPGQREQLGIGRALMDPRWDDRSLGVLTYTERSMDPYAVRACWASIAVALRTASLSVGGLSTLIVVVRAPQLRYDVHCSPEHGARYVLLDDRIVVRSSPDVAPRFAREVARSTADPLVFYLGAGFSRSSSLPLGNDLRDHALRRRYNAGSRTPVGDLARRLYRETQSDERFRSLGNDGEEAFVANLTLEQVIALDTVLLEGPSETLGAFAVAEAAATAGPSVLCMKQLVESGRRLVLITVNFDELLERTLGDRVYPVVSQAQFSAFPGYLTAYMAGTETRVPLLKLHGTITDQSSCVIDATITNDGLPVAKANSLRTLHAQAHPSEGGTRPAFVYVGASLRDVDVVPVLREKEFGASFEEAWVLPLVEASIEVFAESRLATWAAEGRRRGDARAISTTADEFFAAVAAALPA